MSYGYQLSYRQKRRLKAKEYLGGECVRCGETDDLDFDHIDPVSKTEEISEAIVAGWSWAKLVDELDKCQLLCRDCHIAKTKEDGSTRIVDHGEGLTGKRNCYCVLCAPLKREYNLKYRPLKGTQTKKGVIVHGTRSGYLKEGRQGLPRCEACIEANRVYTQNLRSSVQS